MVSFAECPVCLEEKPTASLQPCGHCMCMQCIHKLLDKRATCPLCRTVFIDCTPPLVVFDKLKGISSQRISRNKQGEYGIGIVQTSNGVCISRVYRKGLKLYKNQTIVAVNGLPCYRKDCFIEIMSTAQNPPLLVLSDPEDRNYTIFRFL